MPPIAPILPSVPTARVVVSPRPRDVPVAAGALDAPRPRYARTTHPGTRAALARLLARHGWTLRERPGTRGLPVAVGPDAIDCDVLVIHRPDDAARRAALAARLDALTCDHDHVAGVHAVLDAGPGRLAVLRLAVDGTPLDDIATARGALSAAEASGVLVALGQALAALHHTLPSAWLAGAEVVVTSAGRVVLLPALDGAFPVDRGGGADDVRDLARLVARLLPSPPLYGVIGRATTKRGDGNTSADESSRIAALLDVIARALRDDPRDWPAIGTLAAWCHGAVAPVPVVVPPAPGLTVAPVGRTHPVRTVGLRRAPRRPTGTPRRGRGA